MVYLLVTIVLAAAPAAQATSAPTPEVAAEVQPEVVDYSLPDTDNGAVDFVVPALLVPVINVAYWAPSRFITNEYFADISTETMVGNIRHGWVFDDDLFAINQFGHPYQGGSYFAAARSAGLSFWQSVPYVVAGSVMWEYLMESGPACCYPSVNDLVTTTLGGIAVGEVLWRLSNAILDDSTSGFERFLREAGAFAVYPIYGVQRLVGGDAFAHGPAGESRYPYSGEVSLGASVFGSGSIEDFAVIPRYRLRHGQVKELEGDIQAFDHFNMDIALGISKDGIAGATFDTTALLGGKKAKLGDTAEGMAGFALDFDYFENVIASLGQSGLGGLAAVEVPLKYDFSLFGRLVFVGSFGAVSSDYPDIRHYNVGFGTTTRLWLELRHRRWGELYARLDHYWIHTVSGEPGGEVAALADVGASVRLHPSIGLGFHYLLADKRGLYENAENTEEMIHLGEVYAAWRF